MDLQGDSLIVALAGGIGASKLLRGLIREFPPDRLTVIGNTGDDIVLHGLRICPDLDTVLYTLTGHVNSETGWGVRDDTFYCLEQMSMLKMPVWFRLGDRDLALHIERTRLLGEGWTLTQITRRLCGLFEAAFQLLPMAEGYHPTLIRTPEETLHLQEYLVKYGCRPSVQEVIYSELESSRVTDEVVAALEKAAAVLICPSNPFISVAPILSVPGLLDKVKSRGVPVVAVTPIVEGRALKGPAGRMLADLGHEVSAYSVARYYVGVASHFVLDERDAALASRIRELGLEVSMVDTVMATSTDRRRVARHVLELI